MDVRKFLGEIGYMCGADEPARVGRKNVLVYDFELQGDGEFTRNANDMVQTVKALMEDRK